VNLLLGAQAVVHLHSVLDAARLTLEG